MFGIESANIVGYQGISDNGNKNPGIGAVFMPIAGGATYDLNTITVKADGDFMTPGTEYLQMLNPNGSAVTARYTYVSEDFLKDEFEDEWETYKPAIGWWNWSKNIPELIENEDYSQKCGVVNVAVGTAFLGKLSGNSLVFTSAGEVPRTSTAFNDNGNKNPFFLNYLPVTIDLTDITVSADGDFMTPGTEYLQVLNPNGSAVVARYTYVSEEFLQDEFEDEWETYKPAIGWWNWSKNIPSLIEDEDYSSKIAAGTVTLTPGFSFLGKLSGNGLDFNFPAAVTE